VSIFIIPTLPLVSLSTISYNFYNQGFVTDYLPVNQCLLIYIAAASIGGTINFIVLFHHISKIFQSNNKEKAEVEARASISTILGFFNFYFPLYLLKILL